MKFIDGLEPGQSSLVRTLTQKDIELFAVVSGRRQSHAHRRGVAKSDTFHKVIADGMWGGTLISTVLDSSFRTRPDPALQRSPSRSGSRRTRIRRITG